MAVIDDLLKDVPEAIRSRLAAEVGRLREPARFGLQFERHVPEYLPIPSARIRPGSRVAAKAGSHAGTMVVQAVQAGMATCVGGADGKSVGLPLGDLTVVKRFGEPVFPALRHVETVGGATDGPNHILIEGENHSVLQLLDWTHRGRVDCIYIDPPYNTGASKWRYNNRIVEKDDVFRSSKWLSFMERRLRIARRLLADDGVLIVAIDDYEFGHLRTLLTAPGLFRGWEIDVVVVQNNPRGGGGNLVSNTHEYAVFVVPPGRSLYPIQQAEDEKRDFRRRGRGDNNSRAGRPKSFCAIHVDPETRRVVGVGPELAAGDPYETGPTEDGLRRVYPMGRDGLERVWRNTRVSIEKGIADGSLTLSCTARGTIIQHIGGESKRAPIPSVWTGPNYNAGEQGTNLVQALTGVEFPYPKSIYTVLDCVRVAVGGRKDAVVLDFFGGSGTTAHAVGLLNVADGGTRQCILTTNNEVGPDEAAALSARGQRPFDEPWEEQGICRAVTFPRLRNAVAGRGPGGAALDWEFDLGATEEREGEADVDILSFLVGPAANEPAVRKHLSAYLGVTQKALLECGPFYICAAEGSRDRVKGRAVLLDTEALSAFVADLAEADHVRTVACASTGNKRLDGQMALAIKNALPAVVLDVPVKRAASEGLPARLSYFRLDYLDPGEVEIGARADDLLPALWLMAGGMGEVLQALAGRAHVVIPEARLGFLAERTAFREFRQALADSPEVDRVFIVEDEPDAFRGMVSRLPASVPMANCVQLFRAYLDNFNINRGDE